MFVPPIRMVHFGVSFNENGFSWGCVPTSSGTVCVYSTGIPRVLYRKVYESYCDPRGTVCV